MKEIEKIYNEYVKKIISIFGNKETTTTILNNIGYKLFKNKYKGTYASNQVPLLNNKQPYCIINVDKSNMQGSHWVAVAYKNKKVYVYDSFGRKTKSLIPHFRYKIYQDTEYDPEQNKSEDNCGQRCLAWLLIFDKYGPKKALQI